MPHRFFCPDLNETGFVTLRETEAHHLTHVLRHQFNDVVELFNGEGLVVSGRIGAIRKRDVEIEVISSRRDSLPQKQLTLATAVPKGDRFDWLIEKATELGVTRLIPIITLRSIVDPRTSKLDKLRQTVITACKQSGRNHLMEISSVTQWVDLQKTFTTDNESLIAHPNGDALDTVLTQSVLAKSITIAIGPEGGFSDEEVQSALCMGAKAVHLGQHILRIETAAIALSARLLL